MAEVKNLAQPCAVNFWTFAIPVVVGTTAARGVGYIAKRMFNGEHAKTQETAMLATQFGAFWLIAGFVWIAICKRNGVKS